MLLQYLGCVPQAQLPSALQQAHRSPVHRNVLDRRQEVHGQQGPCDPVDVSLRGQGGAGTTHTTTVNHLFNLKLE